MSTRCLQPAQHYAHLTGSWVQTCTQICYSDTAIHNRNQWQQLFNTQNDISQDDDDDPIPPGQPDPTTQQQLPPSAVTTTTSATTGSAPTSVVNVNLQNHVNPAASGCPSLPLVRPAVGQNVSSFQHKGKHH